MSPISWVGATNVYIVLHLLRLHSLWNINIFMEIYHRLNWSSATVELNSTYEMYCCERDETDSELPQLVFNPLERKKRIRPFIQTVRQVHIWNSIKIWTFVITLWNRVPYSQTMNALRAHTYVHTQSYSLSSSSTQTPMAMGV